eukprot:gene24548-31967_t
MHGTSVQRSAALGWRKRGRKSLKYSEVSGMENGACWIDVYLCEAIAGRARLSEAGATS